MCDFSGPKKKKIIKRLSSNIKKWKKSPNNNKNWNCKPLLYRDMQTISLI